MALRESDATRHPPFLVSAEDPVEEERFEGRALFHVGQVTALLDHVHLAPG